MNRQAVHSRIKAHLIKQGKPSMLDSNTCAYRSSTGEACAVGCLISNEVYARYTVQGEEIDEVDDDGNPVWEWPNKLENESIFSHTLCEALGGSGIVIDDGDLNFLRAWQSAHDSAPRDGDQNKWVAYIESCAETIAKSYKLNN